MNNISKDYLWITFGIMIICWGICVLCSVNGYALNEYYVLYIPWILGGLSPTIASYFASCNCCIRCYGKTKEAYGRNNLIRCGNCLHRGRAPQALSGYSVIRRRSIRLS